MHSVEHAPSLLGEHVSRVVVEQLQVAAQHLEPALFADELHFLEQACDFALGVGLLEHFEAGDGAADLWSHLIDVQQRAAFGEHLGRVEVREALQLAQHVIALDLEAHGALGEGAGDRAVDAGDC